MIDKGCIVWYTLFVFNPCFFEILNFPQTPQGVLYNSSACFKKKP